MLAPCPFSGEKVLGALGKIPSDGFSRKAPLLSMCSRVEAFDCDIAGAEHHCCQRRALNEKSFSIKRKLVLILGPVLHLFRLLRLVKRHWSLKRDHARACGTSPVSRLQHSGKEGVLVSMILVLTLFLCSYFSRLTVKL